MGTLGLETVLISNVGLSCAADGSTGLHNGTIVRLEDGVEVSSLTGDLLTEDGNWDALEVLWSTVGDSHQAGKDDKLHVVCMVVR